MCLCVCGVIERERERERRDSGCVCNECESVKEKHFLFFY